MGETLDKHASGQNDDRTQRKSAGGGDFVFKEIQHRATPFNARWRFDWELRPIKI
jgi:hypothetical protein